MFRFFLDCVQSQKKKSILWMIEEHKKNLEGHVASLSYE